MLYRFYTAAITLLRFFYFKGVIQWQQKQKLNSKP